MASGVSTNPENGYMEASCEKTDEDTTREGNRQNGKIKTQDETEPVNGEGNNEESFDFTNPDALIKQLEKVDLTEEDTEELLHEAYKVNMKLKEILRRQESKRRDRGDRMSSAKSAYSVGSKPSRAHTSSVLPPIQRKKSVGAERQFSGLSSSSTSKMSHNSAKRRGDNDSKQPKRSSTSRSTKDKPVWDDRFSYS